MDMVFQTFLAPAVGRLPQTDSDLKYAQLRQDHGSCWRLDIPPGARDVDFQKFSRERSIALSCEKRRLRFEESNGYYCVKGGRFDLLNFLGNIKNV